MKKSWQLPFVLVLLFVLTCSGGVGASRILTAPTGDLLASGHAELDFNRLRGQNSLEFNLGLHPRFNLGVRQYFGSDLVATAKLGLFSESADYPALALGGEFGLEQSNVYLALSKQIGAPGLRAHFAWGSGRYAKGMAGIGLVLNPVQTKGSKGWSVPTTSLVLEYDGQGLIGGIIAEITPEFAAYLGTPFGQGIGFGLNYQVAF